MECTRSFKNGFFKEFVPKCKLGSRSSCHATKQGLTTLTKNYARSEVYAIVSSWSMASYLYERRDGIYWTYFEDRISRSFLKETKLAKLWHQSDQEKTHNGISTACAFTERFSVTLHRHHNYWGCCCGWNSVLLATLSIGSESVTRVTRTEIRPGNIVTNLLAPAVIISWTFIIVEFAGFPTVPLFTAALIAVQ